jgi:acyl transferase domain-containing protein/thioesterase domain-containing protein/acyl carrier protein
VERRGLYHLARAQEQMFGLGVGSRVLQFFSLNFDGSVWDFTMTWPVGATLVLADPAALLPGSGLTQLLKKEDIHAVMVTPSALIVTPYQELPALHTLITAGEALPEELVRRWAPGRRFFNVYGPTETTVVSVIAECRAGEGKPPIGRPFEHVEAHILDSTMGPVPVGVPGELYLGGPGVARGYLARPDLTATLFVNHPFSRAAGARLYKTGDRVKWLPDGNIDYLGRVDRQIKLRGFRIELGEIESELDRHPAVQVAAVELVDVAGDKRLIAYIVPRSDAPERLEGALKNHLHDRLPEYMVPSTIVALDRMPMSPSGKVDRAALPAPPSPERGAVPASTSLEQAVAAVWQDVLGVHGVGLDAPFFEVGGHSLALARVQAKLSARLGVDIDLVTLMRLPTIRQLAAHLASRPGLERAHAPAERAEAPAFSWARPPALAIVGMAIRAPGVRGPEELWEIVHAGRETIRALDPEALIAAGADPDRVRRPDFIPAEGVLDDADQFDAAFFGFSNADAALMDPQHRLFLECACEALEHAGCDPTQFQGRIGVFGGAGAPLHWLGPVMERLRATGREHEILRARTLNAPDFLTLRVAFKLGLRGPAVTVQTACSTSLAAIHLARQSLLAGECDVALAGGVTLSSLTDAHRGYLHTEGGHESADGHCRPFDVDASGMVKSSGVALVALKRLSDAIANGDTIHAVVLGSAMNNDGPAKIGFTAPSEDGLADVIQRAYEAAGVNPESVQLVEAHGTGTRLGDPTEVRALTRAYRRWTEQRGFCALGSLKANLGHLDAAAGAAGVIKAALALAHEVIPPVAGFRAPNPLLDLPSTPFFVSDAPRPWPRTKSPRRAGVTAMGVGGTNVHVVLEEAPSTSSPAGRRPFQLLRFSARTETALAEVARRLGAHLADHPSIDIADVAHTLAMGRAQQRCRATMVCQDTSEARGILGPGAMPSLSATSPTVNGARSVVFLFPGHGVQYPRMGLEIYEAEPLFRAEIDRCLDIVRGEAGLDLRPLWLGQTPEGAPRFEEMQCAQALLFAIEYALARQMMAWGARPVAMLGHSLGEYVAACLAGVFSLRDALGLVAARGRLMDSTPPGGMLAVFADPQEIEPHLGAGVVIGTHAPGSVVLSGLVGGIEAVRARLSSAGIETSSVRVSRASHSPVMRAIRGAFRARVAETELRPPAIPIVSNVTGRYLTAEQATSPDYWAEHLCSPVRLTDGLGTLLDLESPIGIELGPGMTLGSFLVGHPRYGSGAVDIVGTLPSFGKRDQSSCAALLRGLGRAWELGVEIDWRAFYGHERRRRIPLPTYPFEGRRFTLGPGSVEGPAARGARPMGPTPERPERLHEVPQPGPYGAARLAPEAADGHDSDGTPDVAQQLVERMWRRLLGVSRVPAGASFFDLGGDSLLAVQLLSELRVRTGCEIKVRQFVAQPTVDGIAALLHRQGGLAPVAISMAPEGMATAPVEAQRVKVARAASTAAGCLVPLRSTGKKRPFFCVHPIGGSALCYAPLARALDPERPFFGLKSPMLEDHSVRPSSIEELATTYLDAIRQVQPAGPYLLGGWSFGGVIATEMARQLKSRGQAAAELVLFDVSAAPPQGLERLRRIDERLPVLAMLPAIFAEAPGSGRERTASVERLAEILGVASRNLVLYEHHLALWRRHTQRELDVPATHFVAQGRSFFRMNGRKNGSRGLAVRAPTIVPVPGDHFSMLSGERALLVGEQLEGVLDAADRRTIARAGGAAAGSMERDEAAVRALIRQYIGQTLELSSASLVERLWAQGETCTLVAMGGPIIAGSGPIQERLARGFAVLKGARVRLHDENVLILAGGQAACVTTLFDSDLTLVRDGRLVSYRNLRVTWVLEKQGDVWRVVHAHYSVPVGEPGDPNE